MVAILGSASVEGFIHSCYCYAPMSDSSAMDALQKIKDKYYPNVKTAKVYDGINENNPVNIDYLEDESKIRFLEGYAYLYHKELHSLQEVLQVEHVKL